MFDREMRETIASAERGYAEVRARQAGQVQGKIDLIIAICDHVIERSNVALPYEVKDIRDLALDLKLLTQDCA